MKEIWKDIKGYEGRYQISNFGRVKSLIYPKEKIMNIYNFRRDGENDIFSVVRVKDVLQKYREIIEEPKKILKEALYELDASMPKDSLVAWQKANNAILKKEIDELIDVVNKLKEGKE